MKKFAGLILLISLFQAAIAQYETERNTEGTVIKSNNEIFKRISSTAGISKQQVASLNQEIKKQLELTYRDPIVNPPRGFSVSYSFSVGAPGKFSDLTLPRVQLFMNESYLVKDQNTHLVRIDHSSYSSITIQTNGLEEFYSQYGSFWKECDKLKLPIFFEKVPQWDSTSEYIETGQVNPKDKYDIHNEPVRIMKFNPRPVFIPLTRKEYLTFLIAEEKFEIKDDQDEIKDLQKSIEETKKNVANPAYSSVKEALSEGIKTQGQQVVEFNEKVKKKTGKLAHYKEVISAMSSQEAAAPARYNHNSKGDEFFNLEDLVPIGRKEGVALYQINPKYYDTSPGAPVVQVLFISYLIPYFGITSPNFLGKKTVDIYDQLDYAALKEGRP